MPPKSHCFFIKSFLNGYCLDVALNSTAPGTRVSIWPANPLDIADNQLWYIEPHTLTIRNIMTDYCLEIHDDGACVNPYEPGNSAQMWLVAGHFIMNMRDTGEVLDIADAGMDSGADLCVAHRHGKASQRWYTENAPRKFFQIVSRMNEDKVLDVSGADESEGAEVIIYDKNEDNPDNQLWYCGRDGLIRSKLNGYVLDSADGDIKMRNCVYESPNQGFIFSNGRILNLHKEERVLDVKGNTDRNCTNICEWDYHGGDNQLWDIKYEILWK